MYRLPDLDADSQLGQATGMRRIVYAQAMRFSSQDVDKRELVVTGGSLTQTLEGATRWGGSLTVALNPEDPIPSTGSDLLAPFGSFIYVQAGIEWLNGPSVIPFGAYTLTGSSTTVSPTSRLVSLTLGDLAERVAAHRYEAPVHFKEGMDLGEVAARLVRERAPMLWANTEQVGDTGSQLEKMRTFGLTPDTSPWDELTELMTAHGLVVFFDREGLLRVEEPRMNLTTPRPVVNPSITIDFTQQPANVVVARSSAADNASFGVWENTDPSSPTYVDGPYGRVTRFHSSNHITSNAMARNAADRIGSKIIDEGASWSVTTGFDPTWDVEDTMMLPVTTEGVFDLGGGTPVMVRALTLDLAGGTAFTCRSSIGEDAE